ncbi:MAG: O-antigen ligase family protein [Planctomycetaceae bacterium]
MGTALEPTNAFDNVLLKAVDVGFVFLVLVVPFLMGGREAPGQFALVAVACWLAGCWGLFQIRQRDSRWTLSTVEPLIACGVALVVLQVVQLSPEQIQQLSPRLGELLSQWNGDSGLPVWDRLSFMPLETLDSLMVLIAYIMVFVVALQRIRTQSDAFKLMMLLAGGTVAMAAFGLLQYATSNGNFFWFYNNPYTDTERMVKGAFTNRNHFANFIALGMGPLLFCLTAVSIQPNANAQHTGFSDRSGFGTLLVAAAISFVVFAGLLSLSRGGAISIGVATVVAGVALYRSSVISGNLVFGGVCALLLTCGLMAAYGEEQIQKRLDEIASADVEQLDSKDGRRAIWAANIAGIKDFPLVGTGVGTHREIYPMYMEDSGADYRDEFTHAENGYLQVALESGGTGISLLLMSFLFALFWAMKGLTRKDRPRVAAAQAAALATMLASLVHSGVDFVWYVPACVIPVVLVAASACRLRQLQREEHGRMPFSLPLPRVSWTLAGAAVVVLAVWMLPAKYKRMQAQHHWYSYLRMSLNEAATARNASNLLRNRLVAVSRTIAADPSLPRPHARMSALCLQAFHEAQNASENPMSLGMIRNAAMTNEWENRQHMDEWLGRVFEERGEYLQAALKHTKKSLELSPLSGKTYLYLAELDFLDPESAWDNQSLINQAMTVRPHHPKVLFASGRQHLLNGRLTEAVDLWKKAFALSRSYQSSIITQMALVVPAQTLVQTFEPDTQALAHMCDRYRQLGRLRDLQFSLDAFSTEALKMSDDPDISVQRKIRYLLAAWRACDELKNDERALLCFSKAAELDPRDFRIHYQHGVWLANREKFVEAAEKFQACSEIRPGDNHVRRLALSMRKRDLDRQLNRTNRLATQPQFRQLR